MAEPTIRFPVACPQCGEESLGEYAVVDVAAALLKSSPLILASPCHHQQWQATPKEIEQIREYLAAVKDPSR
jgi:hypothetical protein